MTLQQTSVYVAIYETVSVISTGRDFEKVAGRTVAFLPRNLNIFYSEFKQNI